MSEFYVIEAKKATGSSKWLVVRVMDGVMTVYDKFDGEQAALDSLTQRNMYKGTSRTPTLL